MSERHEDLKRRLGKAQGYDEEIYKRGYDAGLKEGQKERKACTVPSKEDLLKIIGRYQDDCSYAEFDASDLVDYILVYLNKEQ